MALHVRLCFLVMSVVLVYVPIERENIFLGMIATVHTRTVLIRMYELNCNFYIVTLKQIYGTFEIWNGM